ncbi:MAG: NAD-dependent epimerase/dehydratase family protein, partial [Dehalococcoidia bacterium]|nr:NAD-dependent epimerase/dehydratase family protein [Dehalococcoidia bacterium]
GFIGAELARHLVSRDEDVVLFDVAPDYNRIGDIKDNVKVVQGNLAYWPEVFNVIKDNNIEGIYHLGSMLSVPSNANPWASFQVNVVGTMNVLEGARLFDVDRVVFISTVATYGLECPSVATDETIQRPTTMYGCGKLYCESLGRFYRSKFGLDFRSIRFPSVIGPGAKVRHVSQYNAWMIEYPILGKPFECFVTEDTKTPVLYFKDAARAADMVYQAAEEQIKTVNYNVAGVTPIRTASELEQVVKKYVPQARITYVPDPEVMDFHRTMRIDVFDDSRAREEWGWQPEYPDLDKVVADFIEEIRLRPERYGLT